jgi:Haem-binding domain
MIKKILLFLLAGLVVIQFIHPKPNKTKNEQPNYIGKTFSIPEDVKTILAKACNDCHTNNTRYPWYSNIQPADWWMNGHIKKGKKGMNLDEYTNKRLRYQYHKMEDLIDQVKQGDMPLNSYTWIHKDAILSQTEKDALMNWANSIMDTLKAKYPIDSLIRKK